MSSTRSAYAAAADDLARRVLAVLETGQDTTVAAGHCREATQEHAALASLRLLGLDALLPQTLAGAGLDPLDTWTWREAFTAFPPTSPEAGSAAGANGPREQDGVVAWRDWAVMDRLSLLDATFEELDPPSWCPQLRDSEDWARWSVQMAQLSPLAVPGRQYAVHAHAAEHGLSLARGMNRALLRRDYATAARLLRWLAVVYRQGAHCPVVLLPVISHVRLVGSGSSRVLLDLLVAERVLQGTPR